MAVSNSQKPLGKLMYDPGIMGELRAPERSLGYREPGCRHLGGS